MATDYDTIATDYKAAKLQPWRSWIESFTLMNLIGDVSNQAVVDLACGEGYYTRRLRQEGAGRVLGIDISEGMIELAREEELIRPLGIDYQVMDGRDLKLGAIFNLAVAAYLLNYARDPGELGAMCQGIAESLKPGGRFVTVNTNPGANFLELPSFRKYGFETRIMGPQIHGIPIDWTFHLDKGSIEVENYYLDVATHERALTKAGFREIRWHLPRLSPLGEAARERDYWADFLNYPPVIFLECVK